MIMQNNYTQYSDELKERDPKSPFYDEIRKMELRIYALEESKRKSETVTKVLQKSKTKLEELKSRQKVRESIKVNLKRPPDVIELRKLENTLKFSKELGTSLLSEKDEIRLAELREKLRLKQENYKYGGVGMRNLKTTIQTTEQQERLKNISSKADKKWWEFWK